MLENHHALMGGGAVAPSASPRAPLGVVDIEQICRSLNFACWRADLEQSWKRHVGLDHLLDPRARDVQELMTLLARRRRTPRQRRHEAVQD